MALVGKKSQVLTTVALPVRVNDETRPRLARLAERMIETCRKHGGIALAAPQVGVSERLVCTFDGHFWINPRIEFDTEDMEDGIEGCLSIPGRQFIVSRHVDCALTATDITGEQKTVDLQGLEARMIQHEVDHLDGILISYRGKEVANTNASPLKL